VNEPVDSKEHSSLHFFIYFMYGVAVTDSVRISDNIPVSSNGGMVSERGMGKNLEGNAHSPVYGAFSWKE
jgi:hypothetical protein